MKSTESDARAASCGEEGRKGDDRLRDLRCKSERDRRPYRPPNLTTVGSLRQFVREGQGLVFDGLSGSGPQA